jgi:inorganic pyrophosphatase
MNSPSIVDLPAFDPESDDLNVVVETPRGSRNKFAYDPDVGVFLLKGVLPTGASFPFDFGFVPSTLGEDGDPLDVLVLMDEPAFCGCLVRCRLIGVIEGEQTEQGETTRNDRLIAVFSNSRNHAGLDQLDDLSPNLVKELEHFFVSYNQAKGKIFKPVGRHGPRKARALVEQGITRARRKRGGKRASTKRRTSP